jgi:hypothetical protein
VEGGNGIEKLDVTQLEENIVELEQKDPSEKVEIGATEDKFSIKQRGVVALTEYPVSIFTQGKKLALKTPTGDKYLAILPFEAIESVLKSRIITHITPDALKITEDQKYGLYYVINGEKTLTVANIITYAVPITSWVSVSTGEVVYTEQPTWYRVLGFLFT